MKEMLKKAALKDALKKAASKAARVRISRRAGIGILCFLLVVFLLYAAVGFWALPSYIKSKAQSVASEKLHRQLLINKLEFNPFTFTLDVDGLSLSEPDSEERFVAFDQLHVELSVSSVLQMTPVVTEFKLVKPFVRVIRVSDRERNFDDILALFKKPEAEKAKEDEAKAEPDKKPKNAEERRAERRKRKFGIYNFQIVDARIELENREKGTQTVVSDLHVGLPYLYRGPIKGISRHVEPRFEAMVNGKKLEIISEKPSEDSRDRVLTLNMDNIDLKRIFNYLPLHPAYKFNEGWLDLNLSLHVHRPKDGETSMDLGGRLTVRAVHMTQSGKPLLDLEKLDVHLGTNALSKAEYHIDRLEVLKPEIHVINDKNGVLNFANLMAHADKVIAAAEEEEKKAKDGVKATMKPGQEGAVVPASLSEAEQPREAVFELKELLVRKARVRYTDQSEAMPMEALANGVDLAISDIAVDLNTHVARVGQVKSSSGSFDVVLSGGGSPFSAKKPEKKAEAASPFTIQVDRLDIANWSGKLKNDGKGNLAALPVSASISRFGLNVDKAQVDMQKHTVSVGQIGSTGGFFDVLMENEPPKVPLAGNAEKKAGEPYHIQIGKVDIANWSGKVKNSNRLDPFETPFSATLSKLGVAVESTEISLKDQTVSVAGIHSKGGSAEVELEPFQKPSLVGKRAAARAALLASVIEAGKAQPADGFAVSIGKVGVTDWSVRMKNQNTTDRAGLPISARASQVDLSLSDIKLDTKKRDIRVGEVASKGGSLMGQLEKHEKVVPKKAADGAKPVVMPSEDPYAVSVGKLAITGWSVKGRNINLKNPLGGGVTDLSITGQNLSSLPGESNPFSVRATLDKTGKLAVDGKVGLSPLNVALSLEVKEMSLLPIQPYIEDYVNVTLNKANLSLLGSFHLAENKAGALEGGYKGDITVTQLRTVDQINKDSFIRWNMLALKDVDAKLAPLSVNIKEAELDNFFARLILNADGRLNLRNILRSDAGGQKSLTETDSELDNLADMGDGRESVVQTKGNVTVGPIKPDADGAGQNLPLVFVEKLTLKKGRVRFTDNFIKPNYTANIAEMEGTVAGFSSDPDAVAKLDIRGQVNNAPLVVAGTISPLKEHLTLDVKAQVRGMELAQFSSYTTKYIGYGIDKGKLSFDVEYKLEDGVLVAQNRLILDQLTFGEKAPGEPVTSLPVELAVSLLKDSNGVIDINLPVGGSLDDPNFSIGGIMAKVFLGSLQRVVFAPFSFLSIKFGGGAELSWLEFAPGSSEIPQKEIAKLEALSKAFAERPELKLDITGRYDPSADRAGLAKAAIQRKVRAEKRKDLQAKGQTVMMNQVKVEESEYPALLERVYKDEDVKKPRNLIGIQKKLSVPEMEKVLIDGYEASEEEFLALAYRRAEGVKFWLVDKGKVADSRIFLLASKAGESGENGETAARVDFALQQ